MKTNSWKLVVCGITHKTSSLEQRETLQLGHEEMPRANAVFSSLPRVLESVIVSTCNRVEFYFVTGRQNDAIEIVAEFYQKLKGLDIQPYKELFLKRRGRHTADHLFRVAAGIDSMVLGENEILGQVREAYSSACAVKAAGKVVHRLFHQAFRVGKQVRTDTKIGKGACSVSTAAVDMIEDTLGSLERPVVLFVGINHMIDLAAGRLARTDNCRLMFANRTTDKAVEYAARFGSEGFGLERLPELMTKADVIVSCTSSPEPIVTRGMMTEVIASRSGRRLVIVDMAIPRDVDIPKNSDPSVQVFDLEDIKRFVKDRQQQRELAIPQVEDIIERRLDEFDYWYEHVLHEPLYNGRYGEVETLCQEELAPILDKLPPELRDELSQATRRIVDRVNRIVKRTDNQRSE
ncbi:MAG: glutamyl-tRNA reductase [Candidatus Latescibacterota bacterium]|nr:MAG: glutamyl-tRNA reductase [Candidatus Latescibacterota bacterium]